MNLLGPNGFWTGSGGGGGGVLGRDKNLFSSVARFKKETHVTLCVLGKDGSEGVCHHSSFFFTRVPTCPLSK